MGKQSRKATQGLSEIQRKCRLRKGHYREVNIATDPQTGAMDLLLPHYEQEELLKMLPNVSIVTITKDRGMFAGLMLYNWINIKYPREKLEWVILGRL